VDLFLSAVGCFVLRYCFRLVAEERWRGDKRNDMRHWPGSRSTRICGCRLILLALATNEHRDDSCVAHAHSELTLIPSRNRKSLDRRQHLLQFCGHAGRHRLSRLCTKLHYGVVRTGGRFEPKARRLRIMLRQAIEEHCLEKRFVYLDSTL